MGPRSATTRWVLASVPCLISLLSLSARARADDQRLGRVTGLETELEANFAPLNLGLENLAPQNLGPSVREEEVTSCGASIPLVLGGAAGKPGCRGAELGLEVEGLGAEACRAGDVCSFTVRVSAPAQWPTTPHRFFQWAPRVILAGPALVHVAVTILPPPLTHPHPTAPHRTQAFVLTYTAWEPGVYRAHLVDQCGLLKLPGVAFPPHQGREYLNLVASWSLVVHARSSARSSASSSASSSAPLRQAGPRNGDQEPASPTEPRNPCLHSMRSIPARWLRTRAMRHPGAETPTGEGEVEGGEGREAEEGRWEEEYKWVPYDCAEWSSPQKVAELLVQKGVREVAFVGDSHMRCLTLHLASYLSGSLTEEALVWSHHDFSFLVRIRSGSNGGSGNDTVTVQFSFFFVDGVYRNGEFGCKYRGISTNRSTRFPPLRDRPDLAVLGAGAWSVTFCDEPGVAYASHLEDFLAFYANEFSWYNVSSDRVSFMGTVPRPTCRKGYPFIGRPLLQFVNEVAQMYTTNHGFSFFNSLEVASPLFHLTCSARDHHFTCKKNTSQTGLVELRGAVGKAITLSFLQLLASQVG